MHGHQADDPIGRWHAYPLSVSHISPSVVRQLTISYFQIDVIQKNGYDCGLWVLAGIAAVLRGYDVTDFLDEDMPWFRRFVAGLVMSIPIAN
jgi:hypothetical protein